MRPHGRAKVSAKDPQAFAICDSCGFLYNHSKLQFQLEWAGNKLINQRQLVCPRCNDVPNQQLRAIVLPADPVPIMNPRPQDYSVAETDYRIANVEETINPATGLTVTTGQMRITENNDDRVTQTTGEPPGGKNQEPGTDPNAPGNDDPGLPYGFDEVPKTGPL